MCVLATIIGIYPVIYFIFSGRIALLSSKPDTVYNSLLWQVCFLHTYTWWWYGIAFGLATVQQ